MNKNKITPESYSLLQKELVDLEKTIKKTAEELGLSGFDSDLTENGDFTSLWEKLKEKKSKYQEKFFLLENAEICQKTNNKSLIGLGSIVTYKILNTGEEKTVEITDAIEADPPQKISMYSPHGESLLGKKVGDIINNQGKDKHQIKILAIK
ncbi:GreA/GreB family elongation factor [endosymbiont GvMRE of Glomus versiforme]|uniref:GreA/GreB family elongation factor n=1 Tax=endosymbiont GvMRE of Glomus versiforme TaxID=2039283 RepID=UPI000EC4624D|nr:GreA/GreB family elongation factor [endosymbiont GvMRE of Glomus versiforme]RHZ37342.1 Transcription elongation factor GreA [endosymbiont GvMRE of Glomus versiforme]